MKSEECNNRGCMYYEHQCRNNCIEYKDIKDCSDSCTIEDREVEPIKEVCEYQNVNIGYATDCKMMSVGLDITNFQYCPYCGKEIKVKE